MGEFVIGDDLRDNSMLPLSAAAGWAIAFNKRLLLLHGDEIAQSESIDSIVNRFNLDGSERYADSILEGDIKALQQQIEDLDGFENLKAQCDSRAGKGADVLLEQSLEPDTELLVLGYNPKRTLREKFLGTVTEELIHKSSCSIMLVKNERAASPKNVLVAYDFSHHCDQALEWAERVHKHFGAKVHLVNVVPCYYQGYQSSEAARGELNKKIEEMISENIHEFEEKLEVKADELRARGVDVDASVVLDKKGSVSDKLVEYGHQESIDLMLMGSHMRGKIKELFLGSVASALIKKSSASILVAK